MWLEKHPTNTLDHFIPWFLNTFSDYEYDSEDNDESIQRAAETLAMSTNTALQQMMRITRARKPSPELNLVAVTPVGATAWTQVYPPSPESWSRSKTPRSSKMINKPRP